MRIKIWLCGWCLIVIAALSTITVCVYKVDPFFHYHKPDTNKYCYELKNQRSQNDGIVKHFDYDAIITGTSMTECFKTSEFDELFGTKSIKVPFSGGSYKEINDCIEVALKNNPNCKTILRGLDYSMIGHDKDRMRCDLGEYPMYLYDNNPFNDVEYLFNKDIIFSIVYDMYRDRKYKGKNGITSFDDYSVWRDEFAYGKNSVLKVDDITREALVDYAMSEEDKKIVHDNVMQNIVSLADAYPDVIFYYFFTPYSIGWWAECDSEAVYYYISAEKYAIELMMGHDNIKLYSFNNVYELITDLNNYRDIMHYGPWINSTILKWIKDDKGRITKENYEEYINKETEFFMNFDYLTLFDQIDYEDDDIAIANCLNRSWDN